MVNEKRSLGERSLQTRLFFTVSRFILPLTLTLSTGALANPPSSLPYPPSRTEAVEDVFFNTPVRDPYRWLENAKSEEVQTWMEAQDNLARSTLNALPQKAALQKRLTELFHVDSIGVPFRMEKRLFFMRRTPDQQKSILFYRDENQKDHVLIDPNTFDEAKKLTLGNWWISPDSNQIAYQLHPNNSDEATLYIRNVNTGGDSSIDVLPGAAYTTVKWLSDSTGFYYVHYPVDPSIPENDRLAFMDVRFHKLGENPAQDPVIFQHSGNPNVFVSIELDKSSRFLFAFHEYGWDKSDVFLKDLKYPHSDFRPLLKGLPATFSINVKKDILYITTNHNAPNQKILKIEAKDAFTTPFEKWTVIVRERKEAKIENVLFFGDFLVLTLLKNASSLLEVRALDGTLLQTPELPGIGTVSKISGDSNEMYLLFSSYTFPSHIYKTTADALSFNTVWAKSNAPVDPTPFTTEQVWYPSKDGTLISMFIIRKKNFVKDGSAPALLYGYGGFNISQTPTFGSSRYPWLEAGGIYAVANLRGGGEYGEEWHKAGMLTQKQNVFDDFIAAAEYLVRENYTKKEKLALNGGSNGGLLVGAVATQRPDLCSVVLCAVPLLDMIRYPLFGLGKGWVSEYGSPENEEHFRALLAYSPYHHVVPGTAYPAFLMLSASHDDRVDPLHARKMVAALQNADPNGKPILLRIEKNAGHGGAGQMKQTVDYYADFYVFLMNQFGMEPAQQ